jgi:phosphoribosylformylglycinamidine cyclo-ligase
MQPLIRTTLRPEVLRDRGQFAGLMRLPRGLRDPVLVASTDGVGTKLKVAELCGAYEAIGVDAVAMNTNDVLVYGAAPLLFLDYLAVGSLQPGMMSRLVKGIVRGCRDSGCALIGGETAEMPGLYRNGDYDVAGFCVGVVDRARLIDGSAVRRGDAVVGLASSGVHANGFSLVRQALGPARLRRMSRRLCAPTRIYVRPVLDMIKAVPVRAIAHITGGGLARRLPSLVKRRPGLRVDWQPPRWTVPAVFRDIQRAGGITDTEMYRTFNMGIGMALACRARDAGRVLAIARRHRVPAWIIGTVR